MARDLVTAIKIVGVGKFNREINSKYFRPLCRRALFEEIRQSLCGFLDE
jgi:hypothetical protein